jgi:hypothetical protein
MSTTQDVIAHVQKTIRALAGIGAAPDYPPDSLNVFPFALAYQGASEYKYNTPDDMKTLATIEVEIHFSRQDLSAAIKRAMQYADSIPAALLADTTLGGTCSTFELIESSGIIPLNYNGVDTIGIRYSLRNVKLLTTI